MGWLASLLKITMGFALVHFQKYWLLSTYIHTLKCLTIFYRLLINIYENSLFCKLLNKLFNVLDKPHYFFFYDVVKKICSIFVSTNSFFCPIRIEWNIELMEWNVELMSETKTHVISGASTLNLDLVHVAEFLWFRSFMQSKP